MSLLKHGNNKATFTSKRRTARANELKEAREHHKQLSRQALDNPHNPKLRRDPGVPDLSDLHSALERRALAMDTDLKFARQQAYAKRRVQEQERREARRKAGLAEVAPQTSATGGKLQREPGTGEASNDARDVAARRHYWAEMVKVVDASDIILEVLDARDPEGCRCREVETMIQSKMDRSGATPKRIILVMNKIDLVPQENLHAWIAHMKREFPCIAFKANTQQQSAHLHQVTHVEKGAEIRDQRVLQRSAAVGSMQLIQLLKNFSRSLNIKKQITVGIIGYPNVGKSSLINSLTRAKHAAVGNMPGLTKSLQTIKLDHQISLIDSPGVMFSAGKTAGGADDANLLLRNCLRFEQLEDPISVVYKIVERCTMEQLKTTFQLPLDFEDADQFLFQVAQKRGKLGRGGVPDIEAAAKIVIKEWNDGKIEYCSEPPAIDQAAVDRGTMVLTESRFTKEFDISQVGQPVVEVDEADERKVQESMMDEAAEMEDPYAVGTREVLPVDMDDTPAAPAASIVTRPKPAAPAGDDGDIGMDGAASSSSAAAGGLAPFVLPTRPKPSAADAHNPQANQHFTQGAKRQARKARKDANRAAAAAGGEEHEDVEME